MEGATWPSVVFFVLYCCTLRRMVTENKHSLSYLGNVMNTENGLDCNDLSLSLQVCFFCVVLLYFAQAVRTRSVMCSKHSQSFVGTVVNTWNSRNGNVAVCM